MTLRVLYHVICSQWHPLAEPDTSIPRVGYTRLDIDSPFCHFCMTAVHEAKWLVGTKKARPTHSLTIFLPTRRKQLLEEVQSYVYSHAMS